ncbi:ubiquinone anaerobic biosynthesis accessory factor UbiT [Marinicella rhabdoformis]|uniref:ubiquinone anaerobic biosynthesis accessory factor UbiT n=1 Tax=Marinicella rhabdoformis TaxID=2580566 RepID=UPI0015D0552C|nr:SCP2 sterol-binding domain-containing protein [Marinicella rhabdoformis]
MESNKHSITSHSSVAVTQKAGHLNKPLPQMPMPLQRMLSKTPWLVSRSALSLTLNQMFKTELKEGALSFLEGKKVAVDISDGGLKFCLSLAGERLQVSPFNAGADLVLTGSVYAMMLLMSQQADADGLFFKRQLVSEGDTELGLFVKNFLESVDPEQSKIHQFSQKLGKNMLFAIDQKRKFWAQIKPH